MRPDLVEIYENETAHCLTAVESSMRPQKGDVINIRKVDWMVVDSNYSVDHADDTSCRRMRYNVIVEKM